MNLKVLHSVSSCNQSKAVQTKQIQMNHWKKLDWSFWQFDLTLFGTLLCVLPHFQSEEESPLQAWYLRWQLSQNLPQEKKCSCEFLGIPLLGPTCTWSSSCCKFMGEPSAGSSRLGWYLCWDGSSFPGIFLQRRGCCHPLLELDTPSLDPIQCWTNPKTQFQDDWSTSEARACFALEISTILCDKAHCQAKSVESSNNWHVWP